MSRQLGLSGSVTSKRPKPLNHVNESVLQSYSCFHRSLPKNISTLLDNSALIVTRCGLCIERKSQRLRLSASARSGDKCRFAGRHSIHHVLPTLTGLNSCRVQDLSLRRRWEVTVGSGRFLPAEVFYRMSYVPRSVQSEPNKGRCKSHASKSNLTTLPVTSSKLIHILQTACVPVLLPILKEELDHLKQAKLLIQDVEIAQRELCGMFISFFYSTILHQWSDIRITRCMRCNSVRRTHLLF